MIVVPKKIRERRIQWFGHVMRKKEGYLSKSLPNAVGREKKKGKTDGKVEGLCLWLENRIETGLCQDDVVSHRSELKKGVRRSDPLPQGTS